MTGEDKKRQLIAMKWQLIIAGFCIAILFLGLSFVRPYTTFILDILLIPCIIFGCYFGYTVLTIKKKSKKILEETENEPTATEN